MSIRSEIDEEKRKIANKERRRRMYLKLKEEFEKEKAQNEQ